MSDEQTPNETPLPDDANMNADVISEDALEPIIDDAIEADEDIIIKDFLNEDDGEPDDSLDYLNPTTEDELEPNAKEIVVKDYLNEDDGEAEETPEYLKPATPEWQLVARQMREEKEAKKRALLEARRAEDERVIAEREALNRDRNLIKEQQEEEFRKKWAERQEEKQTAVDDMMQRIRAEREQKLAERAEVEEKEFGRKFNYPKPPERKPYPSPSEIKRMEREQPADNTPVSSEAQKPAPKNETKNSDLDSRVSRLSKPEPIEVDIDVEEDDE